MKGHMQLDDRKGSEQEQKNYEDHSHEKSDSMLPAKFNQWVPMKGKPLFLEEQCTIYREIHYPLDFQLGNTQLSELKEVVRLWEGADTDHPLSTKGINAEQLIFFDTETTGLGGGTGNTIFLLGYCHLEDDVVKVKQFFLPGPADEAAMYFHFLQDVNDLSNLVTYNGKAFDWPQVKTRHTLVRDKVPLLPKFGHYDLLHAARRLWKDTLPSCRLTIVEKEILGIERVDDTPGSLAPLLYFDYLKEKDPKIIEGVLKHNEFDVLSLIVLYVQLSKRILNCDDVGSTIKEKYEIARWYEKVKEPMKAAELYEEVAKSNVSCHDEALLALGLLFKKQKKQEDAIDCFEMLAIKENTYAITACIELAKLYEHQYKDVKKALYYSERAYEQQKKAARLLREKKTLDDLKARIERLQEKRKRLDQL